MYRSRLSHYYPPMLKLLHDSRKLWLNPEYQRGAVWTRSQKQLFVDSLLNDIDIPKLYFRKINKGDFEYEVVDGQQRLRTIFEFMENKFRMPKDGDPVDGHETKNRSFEKLTTPLQEKFLGARLDIVELDTSHDDDAIEDMFLRFQNGTQLKAAEKLRAVPGNMRRVVKKLSQHKVFKLCAFKDTRAAYEDAIAKILHLLLAGKITDINFLSVKTTYETHKSITEKDPAVQRAKGAFLFIAKAFKSIDTLPGLKKFSLITLAFLTAELLIKYNLSKFPEEFASAYIKFEAERRKNEELEEKDQDSELSAYTDAARSDSIQAMNYRHNLLRKWIVGGMPELELKAETRIFSEEQREVIFWRDQGTCKLCGKKCDASEFHADHIKPHDNGGETKISNGQVLCPRCNLKKGNRGP